MATAATRVLIQLDRPGEKLDMPTIRQLLAGTDVELDGAYGPILINPKLGRYVVRGFATSEARARAEALNGVRLFADAAVEPLGP